MQLFAVSCIYIVMKKTLVSILVLSTVLVLAQPSFAVTSLRGEVGEAVRETIREGKKDGDSRFEIKKEVRETVREEVKEKNENLLDRVKNFIKKKVRFDARITGTIATLGENTMTVKGEGDKTYTLNLNSDTKLVRRFGGKSGISEFSVGNKVNVFGKFTDDSQTIIDAKLIRNVSIQKKWGVFFGKITSKGETSFVIESSNRGTQTVFIEGAEFKNRKEESILYGDVQVEHKIRVKGMWDRSTNEITEVNEIKDFSIPTQPLED